MLLFVFAFAGEQLLFVFTFTGELLVFVVTFLDGELPQG